MIKNVSHQAPVSGPANVAVALEVAHELHTPDPTRRLPELATPAPQLMGLRTSAARPHRRKVPLNRLTALTRLTPAGV
ncbi:hypothetical protein ACGFYT_24075 [Streptomyces sp. NPDC048208]|uniref:hypothetical protein n=1 Tax=unclassified Streptomyces TaxID=2593676 RepID=UPI00136ECC57|nr:MULTISPECIES: hypothetical protein [unclassified Streptomyces]MBV1945963.1 hypothetical protein [Streptomyces sp. BV129]MYS14591.1 hypothetical protein [Streptomyces sp. SID4982]